MANAYETLGVGKNATESEIKKAYRSMASKHHPDKGGDTAKFQEIQSAYETLTDPQKRHQHDNPNPFGGGGHHEFHFNSGPEDIFSQFFGGHNPFQQQQRQARRNKDLRINIVINLASTLEPQTRTVSVQTTKGDRFNVDVNIPRGVSNGTTIKYSQLGDNMFETLTRGDLYVIISIQPEVKFEIHGINLFTELTIDSIDAMTGIDKEISGVDGRVWLVKIPAGAQYGTRFSLQGQGLYQMNSSVRGDLIAQLTIKTPSLSNEQLNILRTLKSSL
jgi:curved DNA-binding protein